MSPTRRTTSRRPRYVPFLVTGALVGVVAALVVALTLGRDVEGQQRLAIYLCILFAGFGALAAGGLAVWLERGDRKRPVD